MKSFWAKLAKYVDKHETAVLMYVLDSKGSSPGRKGFSMFVGKTGELYGSIGGGIMEFQLVEFCKTQLLLYPFEPFLKRQIHNDKEQNDKSGLICSGEQTIGFFPIQSKDLNTLEQLISGQVDAKGILILNINGIKFSKNPTINKPVQIDVKSAKHWHYEEDFSHQQLLQIIGGGHVGFALSKMASELGFRVVLYDNRPNINTIKYNQYAKVVPVDHYKNINQYLDGNKNSYLVIMSFGYQIDKMVLSLLIDKEYQYLGLMGSNAKIKRLWKELLLEGVEKSLLDQVKAPIGIQINSKTPSEIAISILAEMIAFKNKH